jgi:hypothetical protein
MFCIYYGDGSVFHCNPESGVSGPEAAPTQDVQCIAWNDPIRGTQNTGRVVMHDWDLYIYSDKVEGWIGTNKYADLVRHVQGGGVRAVLEGKWIRREAFMKIRERAETDPGLNVKSAIHPSEDGTE